MLGQQTIANIVMVAISLLAAGAWILIGKKSTLDKTVGAIAVFLLAGSILLTAYYFYWTLYLSG